MTTVEEFDAIADAIQRFRVAFHTAVDCAETLRLAAGILPEVAALLPDTANGGHARRALATLEACLNVVHPALVDLAAFAPGVDASEMYGTTLAVIQQLTTENPT